MYLTVNDICISVNKWNQHINQKLDVLFLVETDTTVLNKEPDYIIKGYKIIVPPNNCVIGNLKQKIGLGWIWSQKTLKITQDEPGMDQGTRVKGKDMQCMKGVLVKDTHLSHSTSES